MSTTSEPTRDDLDEITALMIHACRSVGMTPSRAGSAGQWGMLVRALIASGWKPAPAPSSRCCRVCRQPVGSTGTDSVTDEHGWAHGVCLRYAAAKARGEV